MEQQLDRSRPRRRVWGIAILAAFGIVVLWLAAHGARIQLLRLKAHTDSTEVPSPFIYSFNTKGILAEAGNAFRSTSPYWWLNSGGLMYIESGMGQTIHGELPTRNPWRELYARTNPVDTDLGYHPQNIFRAVTRSQWEDLRQQAYFRVADDNLSASLNRNESNGLLLFNRYKDADNLYYAGIRVDGTAVIKKKIGGTYYTLAQAPLFADGRTYDRVRNPNLIPKDTWIGVRSEVVTTPHKTVDIKVFVDVGATGNWKLAAEAMDQGENYGPVIDGEGYAGIRTDFMDVDFRSFRIEDLDA